MFEFNTCQAFGKSRVTAAKFLARQTLKNLSKLQRFDNGLSRTVSGYRVRVVELIDAKLIDVQSFITLAQLQSEGTVSKQYTTCAKVSLSRCHLMPRVCPQVLRLIRLRSGSTCDLFFLLSLTKSC